MTIGPLNVDQVLLRLLAGPTSADSASGVAPGQVAQPALAEATAQTTAPSLRELTLLLGLPAGPEGDQVVSALIRDALPLTPDLAQRVLTLWRDSGQAEPTAAALLWLDECRIPATPGRARLVQLWRLTRPGDSGPPVGTMLINARWTSDRLLGCESWFWAGPPSRGGAGSTANEYPVLDAPDSGHIALLLDIETAHLGAVEALITVAEQQVEVALLTPRPATAAALNADLSALREALAATGLMPTGLAAALAEPGSPQQSLPPGIRRLDIHF
jgi:flagellar hook-length control protein FliK